MPALAIDVEAPFKIWKITFDANGAAILPDVGRPWMQIGVRRQNAAGNGAATFGSGTLKIQPAGVGQPTVDEDNHWFDTVDASLAALAIGNTYQVELVGPVRIVLSGATDPDFVVEIR